MCCFFTYFASAARYLLMMRALESAGSGFLLLLLLFCKFSTKPIVVGKHSSDRMDAIFHFQWLRRNSMFINFCHFWNEFAHFILGCCCFVVFFLLLLLFLEGDRMVLCSFCSAIAKPYLKIGQLVFFFYYILYISWRAQCCKTRADIIIFLVYLNIRARLFNIAMEWIIFLVVDENEGTWTRWCLLCSRRQSNVKW